MRSTPTQAGGKSRTGEASFIQVRLLLLVGILSLMALGLLAGAPVPSDKPSTYPAWWFSRGVIPLLNSTNTSPLWDSGNGTYYPKSDDYAVINEGQLKNFAIQAYNDLQANAPSYVWSTTQGEALTAMIDGWSPTASGEDDYQAINLGQLKTVAKPFYDVLVEIGYTTSYPWSGTPDDYSVANIGQVKNLFSFDVGKDTDSSVDGLPDWWEKEYFNQLGQASTSLSPSGNGLTLATEYQQGDNPYNYYNQGGTIVAPVLSIAGGNYQTIATTNSEYQYCFPQPLVVQVTHSGTNLPWTNAPVIFSTLQGSLGTSSSYNTNFCSSYSVTTDSNGMAQIYYAPESSTGQVTATAGGQTVTFTEPWEASSVSGWWQLEETSGTTATDSSGNGNNGTINNGFTSVTGVYGNAYQFNGSSDQYISVAGSNETSNVLQIGSNNLSMTGWFKSNSSTANTGPIFEKESSGSGGYYVSLSSGAIEVRVQGDGSGSNNLDFSTTTTFNDTYWHQVIVVMNATTFQAQIYVDGAAQPLQSNNTLGTVSTSAPTILSFPSLTNWSLNNSQPLTIAYNNNPSSAAYFTGTLDDLRVYAHALTATEINSLIYGSGNEIPDWWQMRNFGSLGVKPGSLSLSGDGLTNFQEYQQQMPVLVATSGNNQVGAAGTTLPSSLVVTVQHASGTAFPSGTPVKLTVTQGGGSIVIGSSTYTSTTLTTNSSGQVSFGFIPGSTNSVNTILAATQVSGVANPSLVLSAYLGTGATGNTAPAPSDAAPPPTLQADPQNWQAQTWQGTASVEYTAFYNYIQCGTSFDPATFDETNATLYWSQTGASGYSGPPVYSFLVEYKIDNGPWYTIGNPSGSTTYINGVTGLENLKADQTYYYRVTPIMSTGASGTPMLTSFSIPVVRDYLYSNGTGGWVSSADMNQSDEALVDLYNGDYNFVFYYGGYVSVATGSNQVKIILNPTCDNTTWNWGVGSYAPSATTVALFSTTTSSSGQTEATENFTATSSEADGECYLFNEPRISIGPNTIESDLSDFLSPAEKSQGVQVGCVHSSNPTINDIKQNGFSFEPFLDGFSYGVGDEGLSDFHYTLSWSGAGTMQIYGENSDGSYTQITAQNVTETYSTLVAVDGDNAQAGDSLTVNVNTIPNGGTTTWSTDTIKFIYQPNGSVTVPVDDCSGAQYRKLALNGRPMPDEKPQQSDESDQQPEETFIDAMTLGLRHSTTDAYVPVPGSEFALSARRNTESEVWNMRYGLRPSERPDLPFGPGWSSNLAANIKIQTSVNQYGNLTDLTYAYVTDENGASYRFGEWTTTNYTTGQLVYHFFPFPTSKHEQATYLSTLTYNAATGQYTFTRKFGSTLIYGLTNLQQTISADRVLGSQNSQIFTYARLLSVTDRMGQVVDYSYDNLTSLVPKTISAPGRPNLTLYIEQNSDGQVGAIWDANWNKTTYTYTPTTGLASNVSELTSVTAPDGKVTTYAYDISTEPDQTPQPTGSTDPGFTYIHLDVNSITDPNGSAYGFTYAMDHSKHNFKYDANPSNNDTEYYIATGLPRNVTSVTLPGGVGTSHFSNLSFVELSSTGAHGMASGSQRETQVTDTAGNIITYQWNQTTPPLVEDLNSFSVPGSTNFSDPMIVDYTTMTITYGTPASNIGSETFTFNPAAGMALASVCDFSGNTTTYQQTDVWAETNDYSAIFPTTMIAGGAFYYDDPNVQTNAEDGKSEGGVTMHGVKRFTYGQAASTGIPACPYRIMSSVTDENGNKTTYTLDSVGRRTKEVITDNATSPNTLQETDFTYGNTAFPNFVTVKTVVGAGTDTPLTTNYTPDADGRVYQEIVNQGGLSLTTTYSYDSDGNKLSVTDPNSHTTNFTYDHRNRLTQVTYADSSHKNSTYDWRGNKVMDTDENGHATLYQYDALNRLVGQVRDMNGNASYNATSNTLGGIDSGTDLITQYSYDAINDKLTQTDPNGHTTNYYYDTLQRVTEILEPSVGGTRYSTTLAYGTNSGGNAFDSSSFKPTSSTDPRGIVTTVAYDYIYRPLSKSVAYATGDTSATSMKYDNVGNVLTVTDPVGNATTTTYDGMNRPTQVVAADGHTVNTYYTSTGLKYETTDVMVSGGATRATNMIYDAAGRMTEVDGPVLADSTQAKSYTSYDSAGNVHTATDPDGNVWTYAYDARNRKLSATGPSVTDAEHGGTAQPVIQTGYDLVGNATSKEDARGNTTTIYYDAANRPYKTISPSVPVAGSTSTAQPTVQSAYDLNGNVTDVWDANDNHTHNIYDSLNRLTSTEDGAGNTVGYGYDAVGNRTSVTDGNTHTTNFAYDGLNRNTSITDAASHVTHFYYNALNKTSRVDADGQTTSYTYDPCNRIKTVTYQTGSSPPLRTYGYDLAGNLLSVTESANSAADVSYTYDVMNRALTEVSNGYTSTYAYDHAGNRTGVTYATGTGTPLSFTSSYDGLNRLSSMLENGRTTTYAYDLSGNIYTKSFPGFDVETTTHDALNRDTVQSAVKYGGTSIYSYAYGYDLDSNVATVGETYTSGLSNRTVTNTYDGANRLLDEVTATSGLGSATTAYAYDAANNRTSKTNSGYGITTNTTNYYYNNLNQVTSYVIGSTTISLTYDYNGNRATRVAGGQTDHYYYDYDNRLVQLVKNTSGGAGTYNYAYDYRTRRITRDESSVPTANGGTATVTHVVFSGGNSVREYDGSNTVATVSYIRGSDYGGGVGGLLYTERYGYGIAYTHENKRGDVIAKTYEENLVYQAQYEAFGNQTATNGTTLDRQKSNTKDNDPSGLVDEGMRYRDLDTGMFITRDPAGMVDGPNEYTYVKQNPWTSFDPEGLQTEQDYENDQDKARAWYFQAKIDDGGNRAKQKKDAKTFNDWIEADTLKINSLEESAKEVRMEGWMIGGAASPLGRWDYYKADHLDDVKDASEISYAATTGWGIFIATTALTLPEGGEGGVLIDGGTTIAEQGVTDAAAAEAAEAAPTGDFYSVAYEMKLNPTDFGRSDSVHFNRANAALDAAIKADPEFAAQMENLIPSVSDSVSSVGGRSTPEGWVWHHSTEPGVMQLVPEAQHTPGSIFWDTFHPDGMGGYAIWARPAGAPPR